MRALAALSRFVGNTFAYWVLIFAVVAFLQPAWFLGLKGAIVPLLGLVMFGMGLTLKLEDFAEVARHPWRVALGVVAHFVIMPGVAWLLCRAFNLPPEIAALFGCAVLTGVGAVWNTAAVRAALRRRRDSISCSR